jgi:hypothetical protein
MQKGGYNLPGLRNRNPKLLQQFAGPFKVLEKINPLAYRIELPPAMRNAHPVISIIHLEQAQNPQTDPFGRQVNNDNAEATLMETELIPESIIRHHDQRRRGGGSFGKRVGNLSFCLIRAVDLQPLVSRRTGVGNY